MLADESARADVEVEMRRRIRSFVVVAAALLVCTATAARADLMGNLAQTTPQERAGIQTAFLTKKLALPPDESEKVGAINLKYAEKAEPVIKGDDGMFSKARQMKAIQAEKDDELKTVLSPEQYQAYDAAKDELKQKFEEAVAKKVAAQGGQ
jgi:hypothetical protein